MLHDAPQAIVVGPGEVAPVQAALNAQGLALSGILVTPHQPDHHQPDLRGGLPTLWPTVRVPAREASPDALVPLNNGVGLMVTVTVMVTMLGLPALASRIALERAIKPLMRSAAPALFTSATALSLGALRQWKNPCQ